MVLESHELDCQPPVRVLVHGADTGQDSECELDEMTRAHGFAAIGRRRLLLAASRAAGEFVEQTTVVSTM